MNQCSVDEVKFSSYKRIIPHGYCIKDDLYWRPHNLPLNPIYSNYGLDWSSKLRPIQAYKDENRHDENIWPENSSHLRTFPKLNDQHGISSEWLIYTNGYATGKKCLFDGVHQRSVYCNTEYTLHDGFKHKRRSNDIEQHNGIFNPTRPGDKPYGSVEYSPDFYKIDSVVPKVQFGLTTHIPKRIEVPRFPVDPIIQSIKVESNQNLLELRNEIHKLDEWKPAPTLTETITSVKFSKK
ncbi:Spermatogenesis-associated serine-rich protein [Schistosoma japonicum]|uniref:Spermatogenesis-associated serine-rich protein n=1 Tax=Schistosoma japonicum TaxID=6182 RepID=A0A4Z2DTY6_SCHJA|nr:Spermatogenesis-associated serine-rich protein [Schistosoma japonicum]